MEDTIAYQRRSRKEMAEKILDEIRGIEDVEKSEFVEDNTKILVKTDKEKYPDVMTTIVNIFSRVGKGCELSFAGLIIPHKFYLSNA